MGSLGFMGQAETQPSTSKCKKYRKLLDDCGAVNYASVPRKLRSAIQKRGRESITLKEPHHLNNADGTLKNCAKKSKRKQNMKQGHITNDEKEVAETLYALSNMFSDAKETNNKLELNGEPSETKSLTIQETESTTTATEDTAIPTLNKLVDSTAQELPFSKQLDIPSASGVQSDISLGSRTKMSTFDMNPSDKQTNDLERVAAPGNRYGRHYYPTENGNNGLYQSHSLSAFGNLGSKTQPSCQKSSTDKLPSWLENANRTRQHRVTENIVATDKCPKVVGESKNSWKRCSAHVYISRLINVLKISETKEGRLSEKPTQSMCGNLNSAADSGEIQNAILLHKRLLQNQRQGSEFLSLSAGGCNLDANRAGQSYEALNKFHNSYLQSQNHSSVPFSLPQNFPGCTSAAAAAPQVQRSPYLSSVVDSRVMMRQLESQHQNRNYQVQTEYNARGLEWQNGGRDPSLLLNYAQGYFPHLHSEISSKYQQFSPSQLQFMAINSSMPLANSKRGGNSCF
ncbi:hypothetical protein ACJIZ3_024813 [Penstemon smallii]|uniref:Uncharacterized protein n=1 Tax=Penstemon smallii TaxID=265156 RepID=A0ABD3TTW6_9LAMI